MCLHDFLMSTSECGYTPAAARAEMRYIISNTFFCALCDLDLVSLKKIFQGQSRIRLLKQETKDLFSNEDKLKKLSICGLKFVE